MIRHNNLAVRCSRLVLATLLVAGPLPALAAPAAPAAAATAASDAASQPSRVAVVDFTAAGAGSDVGTAAAENFRGALARTGKFRLIERGAIDKVIREQSFGQSGLVEGDQAAKLGHLLGAEVIVVGSVTRLGETYTVNARFVDVTTGEAVKSESHRANNASHLPRVINQIAARFAGLQWPMRKPNRPGGHRRQR
jgi:curli biogenesis system outer membrane secretion channel CsgG